MEDYYKDQPQEMLEIKVIENMLLKFAAELITGKPINPFETAVWIRAQARNPQLPQFSQAPENN